MYSEDDALKANHLISVIVEHLNFKEAMEALESYLVNQKNPLIEEIYYALESELFLDKHTIIVDKMSEKDKKCYQSDEDTEILDEEPINVEINQIPILLNPWNGQRVINNLVCINENNIFDGKEYKFNIQNYYLYPMNIVVCNGGNHSQFSARMKNQGNTIIKELHDYSNIYSLIEFDGENYIKSKDKTVIELNYDKEIVFYSGVIFELGRYNLKDSTYILDTIKEKIK